MNDELRDKLTYIQHRIWVKFILDFITEYMNVQGSIVLDNEDVINLVDFINMDYERLPKEHISKMQEMALIHKLYNLKITMKEEL